MTTARTASLAAAALLGTTALIAGPALAGTGPGPLSSPYQPTYDTYYGAPSCSDWNRGGQYQSWNCDQGDVSYYGEPDYYGPGPFVDFQFGGGRHHYDRDRWDR